MGGNPIIMGGSSASELQAQLERSAMENERMLAQAADEQLRLQSELDKRDQEMKTMYEQQARQQEIDMSKAQEALNIEIDALQDADDADDLKLDFSALESALAKGMGSSDSASPRPL